MQRWQTLSIRSRMFIIIGLLLILCSTVTVIRQASITIDHAQSELIQTTLPNHLQRLAFEISAEMTPLIKTSQLMANDQFIQHWIAKGNNSDDISVIGKNLQTITEKTGTDFTFYTVDSPQGTQYLQYNGSAFMHILLKDYKFKDFYQKFLNTNKPFELNMQKTDAGYVVFINYRSDAINPNTGKPYSVAGLGIKVNRWLDMVRKLQLGEHGRAMLVTTKGEIQVKGKDAAIDVIQSPHIVSLINDKTHLQVKEKQIAGRSYYLGSLWIPSLDRYLIVEVPQDQISAPIYRQIFSTLVFTIIFIVLALVVLHFVISSLTRPILAIGDNVRHVADTLDLDHTLDSTDQAEIGSLAKAINGLLGNLKSALSTVKNAVTTTDAAVKELNSQANELHQAAEAERQAIAQICSASADIAAHGSQMSELATQAGELSHSGDAELQLANSEVQNTLTSLQALGSEMTSSKTSLDELNTYIAKIRSVLEVISAISEQTNLLALNAAIEAARAGEHGRGFAVVADEVRTLSQRTSDSTLEIQDIITNLMTASADVTERIDSASQTSMATLEGQQLVATKVTELNAVLQQLFDLNSQISDRTRVQNQAVSEINQHMDSLGAQNEQITRLFAQSHDSTAAIANEMRQLNTQVEKFRGM